MFGREQKQGSGLGGRNQHLAVALVTNLRQVVTPQKPELGLFTSPPSLGSSMKSKRIIGITGKHWLCQSGIKWEHLYSGTIYDTQACKGRISEGRAAQPAYILHLPVGYDGMHIPRCRPPPHFLLPISHLQDLLGN